MNAGKLQKREHQYRCPGKMLETAGMLWTEQVKPYQPYTVSRNLLVPNGIAQIS